jgi:hypothetical protein
MFFGYLILLLVAAFLARWLVEGWQSGRTQLPPGDGRELARLREEMDALTAEVQRLSDEQSFMVRLLADGGEPRPPDRLPPADGEPEVPNEEKP